MNNWLLTLFVASVRATLAGRTVTACRLARPVLSLEFQNVGGGGDPVFLTAILARGGSFLSAADCDPLLEWPVRDPFPQLSHYSLAAIEQPDGDRMVSLRLTRPYHQELNLDLVLYASDAVLRAGDKQMASINNRFRGDARPAAPATTPFASISRQELADALGTGRAVPGLDPRLRAAYPDGEAAVSPLLSFRDSVSRPGARFWLLVPAKLSAVSPAPPPVEIPPGNTMIGPFTDGRSACALTGRLLIAGERRRLIAQRLKPVRSLIKQKLSLLEKLIQERKMADGHEILRRTAETLAAYQTQVPAGAGSVDLPDPYTAGETVTIALDPARPLRQQIDRLFKRSSKMERSIPFLDTKIDTITGEIDALRAACDRAAEAATAREAFAAIDSLLAEHRLAGGGRSPAAPAEKTFRRFDLDSNWFVLVGRNNRENDELTFHVASPGDYWFHAQQVPGSHVILKSHGGGDNPPQMILERAAAIAAHFSKAKHSSLVPVIYTQRKYVRKPRKALPGRVICSHEKTIFAEPHLPSAK